MASVGPIFIHSLFRCASTYFYQKFRAIGPELICYQEPFNEALKNLNSRARHPRLLARPGGPLLRHPLLDRPYFYEFWLRRQELKGLYNRAFAYKEYFAGSALTRQQHRWIAALLQCAEGRAVLQFCRSSGRAVAMRTAFGGVHLHLWREPRAQWWSYKVADYFDNVTQSIYDGRWLPEPLLQLTEGLGGRGAGAYPRRPQDNYALFYGLWLDAWLGLQALADLSINVDRIAVYPDENQDDSRRLSALVDQAIDLSDIRASGMVFTADELDFYERVEETVGTLFVQYGHPGAALLPAAERAAREARNAHAKRAHDPASERNLRQTAVQMMSRLSPQPPLEPRHWQLQPGSSPSSLQRALRRLWQPRGLAPGEHSAFIPR